MKKWNVRSWKTHDVRTAHGGKPRLVVHREVIEAQIKTEALNRFFEKHPDGRDLEVTCAPLRGRAPQDVAIPTETLALLVDAVELRGGYAKGSPLDKAVKAARKLLP